MQIRIEPDVVTIDGYVNAVERDSKPLWSRFGRFVERIKKGAFSGSLARHGNVRLLLNHDWTRELGSMVDGNLELREDAIGLLAHAEVRDPDVIEKARSGKLTGWSFGYRDRDVAETMADGIRRRDVRDLDLVEVSILDDRKRPAFEGCTIIARSDDDTEESVICFGEEMVTEIRCDAAPEPEAPAETRDEPEPEPEETKKADYSVFEKMIEEMKGA